MNRIILVTGAVLILAAYVVGSWPQHRRLERALQDSQQLQDQFRRADSRNRLGEVLGQLLDLTDAVSDRNYGRAGTLSTTYFDHARQEAAQTADPAVSSALNTILQQRDAVTAALSRSDPSVLQVLRTQELTLRRALGYPVEAPDSNGRSTR